MKKMDVEIVIYIAWKRGILGINEWMDGWMNELMKQWMNGWVDERTNILLVPLQFGVLSSDSPTSRLNYYPYIGFEVLTATAMKTPIFWDITGLQGIITQETNFFIQFLYYRTHALHEYINISVMCPVILPTNYQSLSLSLLLTILSHLSSYLKIYSPIFCNWPLLLHATVSNTHSCNSILVPLLHCMVPQLIFPSHLSM
jgi:hypothetical protein